MGLSKIRNCHGRFSDMESYQRSLMVWIFKEHWIRNK